MKLIGLTGKARSGKDTVATIYRDHAAYQRVAFADPLKAAGQVLFGLPDIWMHESYKEEPFTYWGMSPRRMFQLLGTEAMRNTFGHNFWVRRAFLEIGRLEYENPQLQGVVITDVRFDNEAESIKEKGGHIIRILRPHHGDELQGAAAVHASETPIADDLCDFTILNDKEGIDNLTEQALNILDVIEFGSRK